MQSHFTKIAKLTEDSNQTKKKITLKSLSDDVQDLKNILQETLDKVEDALSMEDEKGTRTSKDKYVTVKGSNARRLSKIIAGDNKNKIKKISLNSLGNEVKVLYQIGNAVSVENGKDARTSKDKNVSITRLSKKIAGDKNKKKKKTSLNSLHNDVQDLNQIGDTVSVKDEKDTRISDNNNVSDVSSNARRHSKKIAEDGKRKKKKILLSSQGSDVKDLNDIGNAVSMEDEKAVNKPKENNVSDTSSKARKHRKKIAEDGKKKKKKISLNSLDDVLHNLNLIEDTVSVKDGKDYRTSNEQKVSDTSSNAKKRRKEKAKGRNKKNEK